MNNNIFPCLWFNGDGKEAADFYCETFDGKITADTPVVLNFELFDQKFMFLNAGSQFEKNGSISFTILCETEDERTEYWTALIEEGTVLKEVNENDLNSRVDTVLDQFGVTWNLIVDKTLIDQKIIPTLLFSNQNQGKAVAAEIFYTDIFSEGDYENVLKEFEISEMRSEEILQNGFVGHFKIAHYSLICEDNLIDNQLDFNEGISLVVMTDDQVETDHLWDSLLDNGGRASMCGWLKDQFGVSWQIVPKKLLELMNDLEQPQKAQKVVEAMMTMQKFDISTLETAYNS